MKMKKPRAPSLVPLGLRVDQKIKDALERAAADDQRSVSSLVVKILREWLMPRSYLEPRQPPAQPVASAKKPRPRA